MTTREITQLDTSLLDPNKSIGWNMYRQFGIDLDQLMLPGIQWNVRAFYAPQEVQEEFEAWVNKNWRSLSKAEGWAKMTKKEFDKGIGFVFLDVMPSSNKENAAKEELQVYADIPSAPADSTTGA
jgi:DNA-directed RNA polymerase delta subunit